MSMDPIYNDYQKILKISLVKEKHQMLFRRVQKIMNEIYFQYCVKKKYNF